MGRALFIGRFHLLGRAVAPMPPLILAQSRTCLAAMVLFPALFLARGRHAVRLRPCEIRDCAILGIFGVAASNYLYYLAIQRTTVATAIILQYLAPVFVLLMDRNFVPGEERNLELAFGSAYAGYRAVVRRWV